MTYLSRFSDLGMCFAIQTHRKGLVTDFLYYKDLHDYFREGRQPVHRLSYHEVRHPVLAHCSPGDDQTVPETTRGTTSFILLHFYCKYIVILSQPFGFLPSWSIGLCCTGY